MPYKDLMERREYQREYQKKWKIKNPEQWKKIVEKSESRIERKEYIKKWQLESPKFKEIRKRFQDSKKSKEYQKDWVENNKDKIRAKGLKYNKTDKGILNQIKKVQNRRIKFKKISGVYYNLPNKELINVINKRDKVCIYCGDKFSEDKKSNKYRSYDHLNPFKKHSINNTVKCCISCNSSKGEEDVFDWLRLKGFKPSKIILNLVKDE